MRKGAAGLVLVALMLAPAVSARAEPAVVAHRGGAGLMPENTLAAFSHALALGVDGIELDVRLSADGVAVVHHDARLKPEMTRDATGRWLSAPTPEVASLTLAELRRFDVGRLKPGTSHARRYPDQQAVDGERIPTLAQVLDLVRAHSRDVRPWIEIKTSPEAGAPAPTPEAVTDAVIAALTAAGLEGRAVLLSFDWRALLHARKVEPGIAVDFLSAQFRRFDTVRRGAPGPSPWLGGIDIDDFGGSLPRAVRAAGGRMWGPHHAAATGAAIAEARALGVEVAPWAVDGEDEMRRLIGLGVAAITTDRPDVLLRILGRP